MHKVILASIAVAGLLVAGGIAAADPSAPDAPTTTQATPATTTTQDTADLDRIVCKAGPAPTGSRLGATRECHSQREWNRIQTEQQQALTRDQLNRGINQSGK